MNRSVQITGYSRLKTEEKWSSELLDMAVTVASDALEQCSHNQVDIIITANTLGGAIGDQRNLALYLGGRLGLKNIETINVDCDGASGGCAIRQGVALIRSGMFKKVLIAGAEKTGDLLPDALELALAGGLDNRSEVPFGFSPSTAAALGMSSYLERYNLDEELFYYLAQSAHYNGSDNSYGMFPWKLSIEQYKQSLPVATPLKVMDRAPLCDGAAAMVLEASDETSKNKSDLFIIGSAGASFKPSISLPVESLDLPAVESSVKQALKEAGLSIDEISCFDFHDSNAFLAALAIESSGLSKKGEALKDAKEGRFLKEGNAPVWLYGGNKSRGYAPGASGVYQGVEACLALNSDSFIKKSKAAMMVSLGNFGAVALTHIIGKR